MQKIKNKNSNKSWQLSWFLLPPSSSQLTPTVLRYGHKAVRAREVACEPLAQVSPLCQRLL